MPVCKSSLPVGRVVVPHGHPLWDRGDGGPCWCLQPLHPMGQRGPWPCSWLLPGDVRKMLSCAGRQSPPHSARMRVKEEQKGREQGGISSYRWKESKTKQHKDPRCNESQKNVILLFHGQEETTNKKAARMLNACFYHLHGKKDMNTNEVLLRINITAANTITTDPLQCYFSEL